VVRTESFGLTFLGIAFTRRGLEYMQLKKPTGAVAGK
jgi:hypothetical protein